MHINEVNDTGGAIPYRRLGKTGFLVSAAGFGCYRVDIESEVHRAAMAEALRAGINLIDTSANYMDGNSELLAGSVIGELTGSGVLKRGDIFVVTKGGYIQGKNYEISAARKKENRPYADLVEYADGLEHCIHPEFLDEQISASLKRLNLESIDAYLLHNPEYYLMLAEKKGAGLNETRAEYYSRIEKAFKYLETEVERGRIKYYGISSNTFILPAAAYGFTSLERVISIAESISAGNHFGVIEFPMNLFERGAAVEKNQGGAMTLLELAGLKNIGALVNRPLNAFFRGAALRLADAPEIKPAWHESDFAALEVQIDSAIGLLGEREEKIINLAHNLSEDGIEKAHAVFNNIFIYKQLNKRWKEFKTASGFESFMSQYYSPRAEYFGFNLKNGVLNNKKMEDEILSCMDFAGGLLEKIDAYFKAHNFLTVTGIKEKLASMAPFYSNFCGLSDMALGIIINTAGVSSALTGMRTPGYVKSALRALAQSAGGPQTCWKTLCELSNYQLNEISSL